MQVNRVQQDYYSNKIARKRENVAFQKGTGVSIGDRITESLKGKNFIQRLKDLEWLKGEIGGILITAVGTGLVAPFPIAYNPFVKAPENATEEQIEDLQNTKKYTAMRQPISALLAILFQVSALKPIDMFLDNLFNKEEFSKYFHLHIDQSEINGKSYVEKLAKNDLKELKKNLSSEEYKELLKAKVKEIENSQIDKVAKSFQECGRIQIGDRFLDNKTLSELINSQVDSYIDDAQKLKIDNDLLAQFTERAKVLVDNENHLREIFKDIPQDAVQRKRFLTNLLSKETNPDVKVIIQEILDKPSEIQVSRVERTFTRISTIKKMCGGNYSYEGYRDAMIQRNAELDKIITKLKLNKIVDPKTVTDNGIRDALAKITESCSFNKNDSLLKSILQDTDTFNFDVEKLGQKIHKDITKKYKDLIKNKYKSVNQVIKILIGVFITLPITCNVLNWVYPRFMRIAFPELEGVKDKHNKKIKEDD